MGIAYSFNVAYGFLLPQDKFALPSEWDNVELWYDGDVDNAIAGSGVRSVYGGDNVCGPRLWGFVAADSWTTMSPRNTEMKLVMDVRPEVVSNLFDIRARVKRTSARIGWMQWADVF